MNFDVSWSPEAEDELADLWLDATRRKDVTIASRLLDVRLGRNAADEGESRGGDFRIAFEKPLAITFRVDLATRKAVVTHVWLQGRG